MRAAIVVFALCLPGVAGAEAECALDAPIHDGARDPSAVDAEVGRNLPSLAACAADDLNGRLRVQADIGTDGVPTAAAVRSGTLDDAAVKQCVTNAFLAMRFSEQAEGPHRMTYTVRYGAPPPPPPTVSLLASEGAPGITVGHPETKGPARADDIAYALGIEAGRLARCFDGQPTGSLALGFSLKRGTVAKVRAVEPADETVTGCIAKRLEGMILVPGAAGVTTVTVQLGYRAP